MMRLRRLPSAALLALLAVSAATAQQNPPLATQPDAPAPDPQPAASATTDVSAATAEQHEFFEKHIRPVLVERCYECHGPSDAPDGGLRLNTRAGLLAGGDSGPAVVAGKPAESRLLAALQYNDPHLQMPPDGRLADEVIARFEEWITRGAADPRSTTAATPPPRAAFDLDTAREHWAYQLPRAQPVPSVADPSWPHSALDHFVLARLEAAGQQPTKDAPPHVLVRRLYFDLLGLAPTAEQIDEYLADPAPDAYQRLVDRLLASPHFGERWGRHWLDVARYGESLTLRGFILPQAWRYRDYVIQSLNEDRSYRQMVREQIAGDLLTAETLVEQQRQMVATTFLALGNTNLEEQDKQQLEMDYVDEQLDVMGRALLGQTLGCARCHDHKFDPIPTRDYYALAGILHNAQALEHANVSKWIEVPLPLPPDEAAHYEELTTQVAALEKEIQQLREQLAAQTKQAKEAQPETQASPDQNDRPATQQRLADLEQQVKALQQAVEQRPRVMSVRETGSITPTRVHIRGSVHNLGDEVPRGFLRVASYQPLPEMPVDSSGRRELAEWLASDANPLTARVMTNRVWHWLMGAGLVRTPDNFGTTGQLPTHPELLDHLTCEFTAHGWSIKHLVRSIVLSRTYRLASTAPEVLLATDPENRLWGRARRKRLDAECLRDAVLQLSGQLSYEMGGETIKPGTKADYGYLHDLNRRSVYLPVLRNELPEIFEAFDFADPSLVTGRRSETTSVPQALLVMNHPFFHQQARCAAERLLAEHQATDEQRLERLMRAAYGRAPTSAEVQLCRAFLAGCPDDPVAGWSQLVHAVLGSVGFRYLD